MAESTRSYIFFGSDEGAAAAAAAQQYAQLSGDGDGWGNETIDGSAATVDEALEILSRTMSGLQMMSMFGGRKVIWLKGANFMGDSPQGARSEDIQQALLDLADCLGNLPPDTWFVLNATEVDKRRSFFRRLGTVAECREFTRIDISKPGWESELASLSVRLAKERSLSFESDALDLFVHRVSENTRQITNELDKLDVYLGSERRRITRDDIERMVAISRTGVIFEISRAIESSDCRRAVRLVNEQLNRGEQAITIMRAAIVPTVRNRFTARLLIDTYGLSADNYRSFEAAVSRLPREGKRLLPLKKDGSPNSYALFNAARSCGKLKLAKARRDLKACAAADRALVSSGLAPRDILLKLIAMLTA